MDEKDNVFPTPENENIESNDTQSGYVGADAQTAEVKNDDSAPWYQQSAPKADNESSYSPYSAQQSYSSNYQQTYTPPTPPKPEKKSNTGRKVLAVFLSVVVVFCAILGAFLIKDSNDDTQPKDEQVQGDAQLQIQDTADPIVVDNSDATAIYDKVSPSCVGIILYSTGNSLFSSSNSATSQSNIAGQGSGIIMGENSDKTKTYIITCAHVISDASSAGYKVVVQDYNGEQYDATVIGFDSKTDLGVLSIDKTGLQAAEFGDSTQLKIGETIFAIGNPGGTEFFGSFTRGMVSAIDRSVSSEIGYDMKCIQHDAAINPGNSGGALINSSGQIIGINSSKIASTEYEGMGFAIPISSAKDIINDIIANGYVTNRPKLGIKYSPASSYQQYAMVVQIKGLPSGSLIIAEISSDSAFKGTKAEVGDLIIKVNGEDMDSADVLLDKIENGNVGDKLTLTLCRINQNYEISEFDVTVTLIEDTGSTQEEVTTTTFDWNQFFGY